MKDRQIYGSTGQPLIVDNEEANKSMGKLHIYGASAIIEGALRTSQKPEWYATFIRTEWMYRVYKMYKAVFDEKGKRLDSDKPFKEPYWLTTA